jgi:hypothetical protein
MLSLRLHHDRHFDFEKDAAGDVTMQTSDGPAQYKAVAVDAEGGYTDLSFPDDYDPSPINLTGLIESITSRNAAADDIVAVSGQPGAEHITTKLAVLLDADIREYTL